MTADLYGDDDDTTNYDEPPEPVHPDDPDRLSIANWHLRRIGYLDRLENETRRPFLAELALLEERLGDAMLSIDRRRKWHNTALVHIHEQVLAEDPKRKTIALPAGTLTATVPKKPRVTVSDEPAFVAWAQAGKRTDLLRVTTAVARDALQKAIDLRPQVEPRVGHPECVVDGSGEVVPGLLVELGAPTFKPHPGEAPGPWLEAL